MKEKGYIMKMREYTIIYKTTWGNLAEKTMLSNCLDNLVSKFEKIKPNATIQKVYFSNMAECGWASYELKGGY